MPLIVNNLPVIISIVSLLFVAFNVVATNYRVSKKQNDDAVEQNVKVLYELSDIKNDTSEISKDITVIRADTSRDRDRILTLEKDVEGIRRDVKDIRKNTGSK